MNNYGQDPEVEYVEKVILECSPVHVFSVISPIIVFFGTYPQANVYRIAA